MSKKLVVVGSFLAAALGFAPHAHASELTLAGSTTVQKRIIEPSAAALEAETGIKVTVRGVNSGKGFEELREGKVKASLSSNPLASLLEKAKLPNDGTYQGHVIMQDDIVPVVHPGNPVSELTWQQLADINAGKVTNWKDVGGPDQPIVVVTSQPTAATRIVFQEMVMGGAPYVQGAREVQSTRQEIELVEKMKGGIGAVSEAFVKMNPGKVKVVKTKEISRPLLFVTKGKPDAEIEKVLAFLKTPKAKALFQ